MCFSCNVAQLALLAVVAAVGVWWAARKVENVGANGLGFSTTAEQAAAPYDVAGRVVLVTGGRHGGVGYEAVRVLANKGAHVYLHARRQSQADESAAMVRAQNASARVTPVAFDLSDLAEVAAAAERLAAAEPKWHVLMLNAGTMMIAERTPTKQQLELTMGVNHVAHHLLATKLLPQLRAAAAADDTPARVVSVSSSLHMGVASDAFVHSAQLEEVPYDRMRAYSNSKLANVLFAAEFNRRHNHDGVLAVSLHPGAIRTNLQKHVLADDGWFGFLLRTAMTVGEPLVFKSIEQGAATQVYCAVARDVVGGLFYEDAHVSYLSGIVAPHIATNQTARDTFWRNTEALIAPYV